MRIAIGAVLIVLNVVLSQQQQQGPYDMSAASIGVAFNNLGINNGQKLVAGNKHRKPRIYGMCPPRFQRIGGECYYLAEQRSTWLEAHFYCKDKNAKLAEPQRRADYKIRAFLQHHDATMRSVHDPIWIGASYNWHKHVWQWSISGKNLSYDAFSRMDPESRKNLENHCAVYDSSLQYRWSARSCLEKYRFICQHKMQTVVASQRFKVYQRWNSTYPHEMAFEEILRRRRPLRKNDSCRGGNCITTRRTPVKPTNGAAAYASTQSPTGATENNVKPSRIPFDEKAKQLREKERRRRNRNGKKQRMQQEKLKRQNLQTAPGELRRETSPTHANKVAFEKQHQQKHDLQLTLLQQQQQDKERRQRELEILKNNRANEERQHLADQEEIRLREQRLKHGREQQEKEQRAREEALKMQQAEREAENRRQEREHLKEEERLRKEYEEQLKRAQSEQERLIREQQERKRQMDEQNRQRMEFEERQRQDKIKREQEEEEKRLELKRLEEAQRLEQQELARLHEEERIRENKNRRLQQEIAEREAEERRISEEEERLKQEMLEASKAQTSTEFREEDDDKKSNQIKITKTSEKDMDEQRKRQKIEELRQKEDERVRKQLEEKKRNYAERIAKLSPEKQREFFEKRKRRKELKEKNRLKRNQEDEAFQQRQIAQQANY